VPGGAVHRSSGFSGGWIFGNDDDLRLLLYDNYSLTTNDQRSHHRGAETQRLFSRVQGSLQPTDPCGPPAAAPGQPITRIASFLRAGSRRCRLRTGACLAALARVGLPARTRSRARADWGQRSRAHAKARCSEFRWEKGQSFNWPRRWNCSQAKVIRSYSHRLPGLDAHAYVHQCVPSCLLGLPAGTDLHGLDCQGNASRSNPPIGYVLIII
jgi:hypothetical protein